MEKLRPLAWLLIVLLALPISAGTADEEPQAESQIRPIGGLTFVDEYELTIANLVVYVTDKKGTAITDLTADDFEVFQDGEAKQITNFKLYTDEIIRTQLASQADDAFTLATPTPAPDDEAGPIPVHMVLYIDNQNLDPLDRNRVLSQTREFVRTSLHPPAQMMVVAYQRFFEVLQPFTSDPNKVMDALRAVRRYTGGRTENDSTRKDIIDRIKSIENEKRSGTGGSSSGNSDLGGAFNEAYQLIDNYAREGVNDLKFTMDALRQTITSLSGLPGKKGIIYVSNGLPMVPGMELFYELNRVTQSSTILTRMYEFDQTRAFAGLAATANAQDVAFYSIDAAGLTMGGMGSAEFASAQDPLSASVGRHNLTDSLRFLADETGGIAIINTNDVGPRLSLVTQDMFTYYSIGYPLQASGRDKVHKVKVKLRDDPAFSDYELRYRARLVEKSLETQVQDTVVSSLVFEVEDNPMQVDVEAGTASPASEKRWLLPTHISFPIRKIALLPEGEDYVGRIVLFVAARDS
ncbi:MAG: VWA domain-containing protein, partial [Thermoanaerobaculales bacterium]|nr:VWA domain-containing protein [Thermoanaerobaculales bacterium]